LGKLYLLSLDLPIIQEYRVYAIATVEIIMHTITLSK